jgi:hypothetical protein
MIKPEQIPYEVKLRLRAILHDGETDEAKAIAAAINAWPGWFNGNAWPDLAPTIVLPLSHENNDD